MSSYYIDLPAAQYPRNALLDFSPIRQAMMDRRNQEQQMYERQRQDEQMQYERGRNSLADARADRSLALQELNARKKDIRSVNEGDILVETDPITGKTTQVYSSGYTPSVSENIFFNRQNAPQTEIGNPEIVSQPSRSMPPINMNRPMVMPQQRSAQDIAEAGPQAMYNTPMDQANSLPTSNITNAPSERMDDNLIKTPFGDITKEQFAQISKSKKPFDQALVKHVLDNQKDPSLNGFKDIKQKLDSEEGLRKEFSQLAKPYFEVRDAYNRINSSAKNSSAAGDLALVFNYMKILDPGSTVREGEFANAQNAAGVPDRVRNLFNNLLTGERLADTQRNDFVDTAGRLAKAQENQYSKIQNQYKSIAKRSGLNVDNVILDYSMPTDQSNLPVQPLPDNGIVQNGNYNWTPQTGIRR